MKDIVINTNTFRSLFIEMYFNETKLSSGTAFFGGVDNKCLLFTNRHNVTGKNNETNELLSSRGGIPNKIKILVPDITISGEEYISGQSQYFTIPLYGDEEMLNPLWFDHPYDNKIDAVGIPFNPKEVNYKALMYNIENDWYKVEIAKLVNVIGYPYGLSVNHFPIWVSGYIASEPNIDYKDSPLFLIDCRTRQGQSGSPVIFRFQKGDKVEHKGNVYQARKEVTHLLGIYSGRINNESDIGRVWKTQVLLEILNSFQNKK